MSGSIRSVSAKVTGNRRIAPKGWIMTLEVEEGPRPRPGQFAHLRIHDRSFTPFLRRPFSIWDDRGDGRLDILYTIRGVGTRAMAGLKPGDRVGYVGPLGNWFEVPAEARRLVLVAGGAGIVPFNFFARRCGAGGGAALLFGARTRDELYALDELRTIGIRVEPCTEDGTEGLKGRVTDLLRRDLDERGRDGVQVFGCGPWGMLAALAAQTAGEGVGCVLSLETRMGCALGACRACVVPVRRDGSDWRFSRVCCEGPNYDARELIFE